jgi:hypothetical protein
MMMMNTAWDSYRDKVAQTERAIEGHVILDSLLER